MNQRHLTEEEIQRLAGEDGAVDDQGHCAECGGCRRRLDSARALERALRRMPLAQASPGMTASVMQDLGLVTRKRTGLWFLESLAGFSALSLVLGTIVAVFVLASGTEGGSGASLAGVKEAWSRAGTEAGGMLAAVQAWMSKNVPVVPRSRGIDIALLMAGVIAALGLLDRLLLRSLRDPARR